jgi:uncharacterized protein (TIGR03067 family)
MMWRTLILAAAVAAVAADDEANKKDLDRMQGSWKVTSLLDSGKEMPAAEVEKMRMEIAGNKMSIYVGTEKVSNVTFTIDAAKKPGHIDLRSDREKGTVHGIYQIDGDTLKMCTGQPEQERPTEFASKAATKTDLLVLKREKK